MGYSKLLKYLLQVLGFYLHANKGIAIIYCMLKKLWPDVVAIGSNYPPVTGLG